MTEIDYAAILVAAIRDIPPDKRLDAIALACKVFIEDRIPEKECERCSGVGAGIHERKCPVYGAERLLDAKERGHW